MSKITVAKKYAKLRYEWILLIYVAIKPLYFFESGGLQLSDMFLAISFGWIIIQSKYGVDIPNHGKKWFHRLLLFTSYTVVINFIWYVALSSSYYNSTTLISSILYYIFNLFAVVVCMNVAYRIGIEETIISVMNGATISSLLVFLGVIINMGKGERNTSFFNNPNQLGFYAVILLTLVCFYGKYISKRKVFLIIVSSVISIIVCLSKASFISAFALAFFYYISHKSKSVKQLIAKGGMIVLLGIILYVFLYENNSFIENNQTLHELKYRIINMSQESDSDLGTGRGYDRIYEMGYNLLWGMGEGSYDRFIIMRGLEIHSTYANIVVSYGLIGSILVLGVFSLPLKQSGMFYRNCCCLSGVLLYCISHNGIRNTLIWILFVCLVLENRVQIDNTNNQRFELVRTKE